MARWTRAVAVVALVGGGWLARPVAAGQPANLPVGSGAAPERQSAASAADDPAEPSGGRWETGRTRQPPLGTAAARSAVSPSTPWGYGRGDGPAVWAELDPAFRACAAGREQSPIDLAGGLRADLTPVDFDYRQTRAVVEDTGHTIQATPAPGSGIVLDGVRYALQQFHFHHRSEHTVDGAEMPLEMHLVHRSESGALAVVGVLFAAGAANAALAPVWAAMPPEAGVANAAPVRLDLAALLPAGRETWRYRGSLTTPPCTEGVAWVVLTEPLTLSAAQIDAFAAVHPNNRRPAQPLGERVLRRR